MKLITMIAVIVIACSVLLAFIRGGRLSELKNVNLCCPYLVVASFIVDFLIHRWSNIPAWTLLAAFIVEYMLLLIFIILNMRQKYMTIIGLGVLLNFLVILFNGGAMPVSRHVLEIPSLTKQVDMIKSGILPNYELMTNDTPLWFLGDIIYVPLLQGQFLSIGDIIMMIGIFLFIQHIMLSNQ